VFSIQIPIPDFNEAGSASLAVGLLGAVDMPPGGARALHQAAGGNPASLLAVLFDLMARGQLERIEGRWKLAEVGRVGQGAIPSLDQRWRRRWQQLPKEHQEALGAIALLGAVDSTDTHRLEERIASVGAIAALRVGGWLKLAGHRIRVASDGLQDLVEGFLDNDHGRTLSEVLLAMQLGADDLSSLMLRLRALPSRDAISEAVRFAAALVEKREFSQAAMLLRECTRHESLLIEPSERADLRLKSVEVSIGLGSLKDAEQQLEDRVLREAAVGSVAVRAKTHWYRGTLASRAGRTEEARQAFEAAIAAAREAGDVPTRVKAVVAHAELAWMHGNDKNAPPPSTIHKTHSMKCRCRLNIKMSADSWSMP